MNAERLSLLVSALLVSPLAGQQNFDSAYRTTGAEVTAVFEPQRAVLQSSSAVILDGSKEINYGVVISDSGHILTKASELETAEKISVIVDREKYENVEILATDQAWDVALLKIDAAGLKPVVYAPSSEVPQGTWVVVNGATSRTKRRALAGIVSAKIREIPPAGGAALGVVLNMKSKLMEFESIMPNSGAEEAGLQKGDVIVSIEGKKIANREDIAELLKDRKAGSTIKIVCLRSGKKIEVDVRLSIKGEIFADMANRNDMMSGDYSKRRSGFPRVMQHDIMGNSRTTGGPVLDLEGRCIGMNIARANRAESFAIPVGDLREIADRLMKPSAN